MIQYFYVCFCFVVCLIKQVERVERESRWGVQRVETVVGLRGDHEMKLMYFFGTLLSFTQGTGLTHEIGNV